MLFFKKVAWRHVHVRVWQLNCGCTELVFISHTNSRHSSNTVCVCVLCVRLFALHKARRLSKNSCKAHRPFNVNRYSTTAAWNEILLGRSFSQGFETKRRTLRIGYGNFLFQLFGSSLIFPPTLLVFAFLALALALVLVLAFSFLSFECKLVLPFRGIVLTLRRCTSAPVPKIDQ